MPGKDARDRLLPSLSGGRSIRDVLTGIRTRPEEESTVEGADPSAGPGGGSTGETNVRFMVGLLRAGIDNAPEVVAATAFGLFAVAELESGGARGFGAVLRRIGLVVSVEAGTVALVLGLLAVWAGLLIGVVRHTGLIRLRELLKVSAIVGVVVGLALGTVASVALVATSEDPARLPPNVVYVSGYLLMLLVAGWYIADGMTFTEGLLAERLGEKVELGRGDAGPEESAGTDGGRTGATAAYGAFARDLDRTLRDEIGPIRSAHLFALLVVAPFAVVWWFGTGPQNLGAPASSALAFLTYAANLAFDFVIAVVAFQFVVLVTHLHRLVTGSYAVGGRSLELRYDLQHPDDCAGLRDLGEFAIRVNVLLVVGGSYLLYRLYVQGLRVLPPGAFLERPVAYNWLLSYVGPVVIYTAVVAVWLYFTFWQLHKKMARDRRTILERWPDIAENEVPHIVIRERDWRDARDAPVWPVDTRQLVPVVVANGVPGIVVLIEGAMFL